MARAAGESLRALAARLGRSPSTISRELGRNTDRAGRYRASSAHVLAHQRASRPKPAKLVANSVLRERVQAELIRRYSPEQIAGRLREDYPDQPEMWVSTETTWSVVLCAAVVSLVSPSWVLGWAGVSLELIQYGLA